MRGVEGVIRILQRFAVITLLASVEPDRDQRKQCKSLPRQEEGIAADRDLIGKTAKHFHVDIPKAGKLTEITPPFPTVEEIEGENDENALAVKVRERGMPSR